MVDSREERPPSEPDTPSDTPTYPDPAHSPSSLPSLPSSSDCSQVTPHSSSYTSWTKPVKVR